MELQKSKKALLTISIIALISFILIFLTNIFEEPPEPPSELIKRGYRPIPFYRLLLSPTLLMIGIFAISYYFISKKLEYKLEKNIEIISKLINKNRPSLKTKSKRVGSSDIILRFLNFNERKVVKKLIEKKGSILQSEISRIEGMNKLKTHRAIKDLKKKDIISIESYGKTNNIILKKEIKNILSS